MQIKYLGHSCFLLDINGTSIIVDPFISPNPSASNIDVSAIKVNYVMLTHGHEDHVADAETILNNNPEAIIISNYEIVSWYGQKGAKGHPMNHGGQVKFDFHR